MNSGHDDTNAAAQQIHALAAAAAAHGRSFVFAVSPAALTAEIVGVFRAGPDAWRSAHVFLADTRFDACGGGTAQARALLAQFPVRRGRLYTDVADSACAVRGAAAYEQKLRAFFGLNVGDLPRFDAMLLHMDAAGDVGGLHADSRAMDETLRLAVADRSPGGRRFITLTPPVVRHASAVVLTACGGVVVSRPPARAWLPASLFAGPNVSIHAG